MIHKTIRNYGRRTGNPKFFSSSKLTCLALKSTSVVCSSRVAIAFSADEADDGPHCGAAVSRENILVIEYITNFSIQHKITEF